MAVRLDNDDMAVTVNHTKETIVMALWFKIKTSQHLEFVAKKMYFEIISRYHCIDKSVSQLNYDHVIVLGWHRGYSTGFNQQIKCIYSPFHVDWCQCSELPFHFYGKCWIKFSSTDGDVSGFPPTMTYKLQVYVDNLLVIDVYVLKFTLLLMVDMKLVRLRWKADQQVLSI